MYATALLILRARLEKDRSTGVGYRGQFRIEQRRELRQAHPRRHGQLSAGLGPQRCPSAPTGIQRSAYSAAREADVPERGPLGLRERTEVRPAVPGTREGRRTSDRHPRFALNLAGLHQHPIDAADNDDLAPPGRRRHGTLRLGQARLAIGNDVFVGRIYDVSVSIIEERREPE